MKGRFLGGVFFFVLTLGSAWVFVVRPRLEDALRPKIEILLSQAAQNPVSIEALRIHPLLLNARVENVRVGPVQDPLFSCSRATLSLSFNPAPTPFSFLFFTFGRSTIEDPVVHVPPPSVNGKPLQPWSGSLPYHQLTLRRGTVSFWVKGSSLTLTHIDGTMDASSAGLGVTAQGHGPWGPWAADGQGVGGERWHGRIQLSLKNLPLETLQTFLKKEWGTFSGRTALTMKAEWANGQRVPARWSVRTKTTNGIWRPTANNADAGVPFQGVLNARAVSSSPTFSFKDFTLFNALHLNGSVSKDSLNLRWKATELFLEDFRNSGAPFFKKILGQGPVATAGTLSGSLKHPSASWTLSSKKITHASIVVPPFESQGEWGEKGFLSEGTTAGGRWSVTHPAGRPWTVRVRRVSLDEWARVNRWPGVKGFMSADVFLERTQNPVPRVNGSLSLVDFSWAQHRWPGVKTTRFSLVPGGVRVFTGGEKNLEVTVSSGVWRLTSFDHKDGSYHLWANGVIRDQEGNTGLEWGVSFPLSDVPPFVKRFPEGAGVFTARGHWHGPWTDPVVVTEVDVKNVVWRPQGLVHQGHASVRGGRSLLTVSPFVWDGVVQGQFSWLFGRGWSVSSQVGPASAETLLDFLPWTKPQGVLSSEIKLEGESFSVVQGTVTVEGHDGAWGGVAFRECRGDVLFEKNKIELSRFLIQQSTGRFSLTGRAVKQPFVHRPSRWTGSFEGTADRFSVSSIVLSGPIKVDADSLGTGSFSSPSFFVGPAHLGAVSGKFFRSSDGPEIFCKFSRGFSASGKLAKGRWSGRAEVSDGKLDEVFPSLGDPHRVWGPWSGSFSFEDTPQGLRLAGNSVLRASSWRGLPLDAEAQLTTAPGGDWVPSVTVRLPKGGSLFLSGRWSPSRREGEVDFKGEGTGINGASFGGGASLSLAEGTATVKTAHWAWDGQTWSVRPGGQISRLFVTTQPSSGPSGHLPLRGEGNHGFPSPLGRGQGEGSEQLRLFNGRWALRFTNDVRNVRLGPLLLFGALGVDAQGGSDGLTATLTAEPFWINQALFQGPMARVSVSSGRVDFLRVPHTETFLVGRVALSEWPQATFQDFVLWDRGSRRVSIQGTVGPRLWDFSLNGWGIPADTLMSLADFDFPLFGGVDVFLRARGSVENPNVVATLRGVEGRVGRLPYDQMQASVVWTGNRVDISHLKLQRQNGYFLSGEAHLPVGDKGNPQDLSLALRLQDGRAAVLESLWNGFRSADGTFEGDLSLGPQGGEGHLIVKNGVLRARTYVRRVDDLNLKVHLKDNRLWVDSAQARVGKGRLELTGSLGLNGVFPSDFDVRLRTLDSRGIAVEVPQLSVPPGPLLGKFSFLRHSLESASRGEPRFDLTLKGSLGSHRLAGEVVLEKSDFTWPPSERVGPPAPRVWANFWKTAAYDLNLKTGRSSWFWNEYVKVQMDGSLSLRKEKSDWNLEGRLEAREGTINYLGQLFDVKKGVFEALPETAQVSGGKATTVWLSGRAERSVTWGDARSDDTVILVVDRAPVTEIKPRFLSSNNPEMLSDRVAMRALGMSGEEQMTPQERDQLLSAGLVQMVGTGATTFASGLAQKFGIYMISPVYEPPENVDTVPGSLPAQSPNGPPRLSDRLRGAGASARVRLTDSFFGVYKVKYDEYSDRVFFRDELELIYRVRKSLFLRASTELDSQQTLGQPPEKRVVLENQWRFGLPRRSEIKKELNP